MNVILHIYFYIIIKHSIFQMCTMYILYTLNLSNTVKHAKLCKLKFLV